MSLAAHATPDGYTLVVVNVGHLINALLAPNPSFDPMKDLVPISLLAKTPVMLVVHPSLNVRTLQEFIALAKSKPGKILHASVGTAGVQHVSTELLKQEAHIDLVHVPYKGTGPGLIDLLAGQVQLTMTSVPSVLPHVQAGKLRALAVTGDHRVAAAPDVPTFGESGLPGVSMVIWYGLMAPAHTPAAIIDKVAQSAAQVARMPDVKEKMSRGGADPVGDTPAQFGAYYKAEGAKWLAVARKANIRLDGKR
jgi:tripartite-type tricarboxylate transporter receptor subunit TctC